MSEAKSKNEERTELYWICDDCAESKKWVRPDYPVTVIHGLCGWCDREDVVTLTPCCDFIGGGKRVWD